jgi:hypothetical protein
MTPDEQAERDRMRAELEQHARHTATLNQEMLYLAQQRDEARTKMAAVIKDRDETVQTLTLHIDKQQAVINNQAERIAYLEEFKDATLEATEVQAAAEGSCYVFDLVEFQNWIARSRLRNESRNQLEVMMSNGYRPEQPTQPTTRDFAYRADNEALERSYAHTQAMVHWARQTLTAARVHYDEDTSESEYALLIGVLKAVDMILIDALQMKHPRPF